MKKKTMMERLKELKGKLDDEQKRDVVVRAYKQVTLICNGGSPLVLNGGDTCYINFQMIGKKTIKPPVNVRVELNTFLIFEDGTELQMDG